MERKTILWIAIAVLIIAVVYMTFIKGGNTGQAVSSASQAVQSAGGMVGGC